MKIFTVILLFVMPSAVFATDIKGISIGDDINNVEIDWPLDKATSDGKSFYKPSESGSWGKLKLSKVSSGSEIYKIALTQRYAELECESLLEPLSEKFGIDFKMVVGHFARQWQAADGTWMDVSCQVRKWKTDKRMLMTGPGSEVRIKMENKELLTASWARERALEEAEKAARVSEQKNQPVELDL